MKRTILALLGALALVLGLAAPASATYYGKPSGKWLQAIVAHEVGHCLGWYEHRTSASSSIMRTSLSPSKIAAGTQTYRPVSADLTAMQASRSNYLNGSKATFYVQYPRTSDSVPIYNRTGLSSVFTAADRWDAGTDFNIYSTSSDPASGITIKWDSARAGTSVGGWVSVQSWEWSGQYWQIADCTVHLNTKVVT